MLPAPTFEGILDRAEVYGQGRLVNDRLVSIVFASPSSRVWEEVRTNRAFLDDRSGTDWDLFFAGMSGFVRQEDGAREIAAGHWNEEWDRYLNPRAFSDIERRVASGHAAALHTTRDEPWVYSGATDLVSFMVYGREPDWRSLVSVTLADEYSSGRILTLGEVTESLRGWQDDQVDPTLAPGQVHSEPMSSLQSALQWSAGAIIGGVLGNGATELLRLIARS